MRTCENCKVRKTYAKYFDAHFDWRDCPYECEYANEREKEEKATCSILEQVQQERGE